MTIKQLSDVEALALSGTQDARTGLVYPTLNQANWGQAMYRALHQFLVATVPDLRVVPIAENAAAVGILPGVCTIAGATVEYAGNVGAGGAVNNLPTNGTRYIWGYLNGGVFTPGSGAALPSQATTPHIPLARVVRSDGVITQIVDLRGGSMIRQIRQGAAVANLSQSISNPPTQAEVTAIQNKVNALLSSLRGAGVIASS